jgi:hypothetical protein
MMYREEEYIRLLWPNGQYQLPMATWYLTGIYHNQQVVHVEITTGFLEMSIVVLAFDNS